MGNIVIGIITGIITGVLTGILVTNLYRKVDREEKAYDFWRRYLFQAMDEGGIHLSVDYLEYYDFIKNNRELIDQISNIMELRGEKIAREDISEKERMIADYALSALHELEKCRKIREKPWWKSFVVH